MHPVDSRPDGEVDPGERVTVLDLATAEATDYRVVPESPLGAALIGRRVGDVVEVDAGGGRRRLEVVELDG